MRQVPPLPASPPGLAAYVAAHPEDTAATSAEAGPAWERFRSDRAAYEELRAALVARQQALCLYCEQRLTREDGALIVMDQQVEHVLAKSGGPGRVLSWTNLALCCGGGTWRHHTEGSRYRQPARANESCGQRKGDDELPHGFDPRQLSSPERFVTVDLEGVMSADREACARLGLRAAAVDEVIAMLNLNCERLRVARQAARAETVDWYVQLADQLLQGTHLTPDEQRQLLALIVAGRLRPDRHGHLRAWWTTVREALGPPADAWIRANQAMLHG